MRLLRIETDDTFVFEEFSDLKSTPPYAILSHTWEKEEVTYHDIQDAELIKSKAGYRKILGFCRVALKAKLSYGWVDTCCIDKSSSAELSEAINSMYRWYQNAQKCFVYLNDVLKRSIDKQAFVHDHLLWTSGFPGAFAISKSRWFTRGWTLQELIAPASVVFFDGEWRMLFDKQARSRFLSNVTGIDEAILEGKHSVQDRSVAQRMFWASKRVTTRQEDMAYCLMGIFNVNMPLLYGEGEKAFVRLQEEIMKDSDDSTLFAWQDGSREEEQDVVKNGMDSLQGLLASSPSQFAKAAHVYPQRDADTMVTFTATNRGIRLELLMQEDERSGLQLAHLDCYRLIRSGREDEDLYRSTHLGVLLQPIGPPHERQYARCRQRALVQAPATKNGRLKAQRRTIYVRKRIHLLRTGKDSHDHSLLIRRYPPPASGLKLRQVRPITLSDPYLDLIRSRVNTAVIIFDTEESTHVAVLLHITSSYLHNRGEFNPRCACLISDNLDDISTQAMYQQLHKNLAQKTFVELDGGMRLVVEISKTTVSGANIFAVDIDVIPEDEKLYELTHDASP